MKLADLDWQGVLATIPDWEALSPAARLAFVEAQQGPGALPVSGKVRAELLSAGMIDAGAPFTPAPRFHALREALSAGAGSPLAYGPADVTLTRYLDRHLSTEEMGVLLKDFPRRYVWIGGYVVAPLVGSAEWVEGFLALKGVARVRAWERERLAPGEAPRLAAPGVAEALQALLRELGARRSAVPLSEVAALLPSLDGEARGAVIAAGIRFLLLFPGVRTAGPEALLGLHPPVARRFGPPPPPPAPVEAAELFDAPFQLADMTTVLVETATTPIPLKNDGQMYVRAQKMLAARLHPLPDWVAEVVDIGSYDDEESSVDPSLADRIGIAASALLGVGYAERAAKDDRYELAATANGARWLALPEGTRLKELLDLTRNSPERNPAQLYARTEEYPFFALRIQFKIPKGTVDLRSAVEAAYLSIPPGAMVPLDDFILHHARATNPFLLFGMEKLRKALRGTYGTPSSRDDWESLWESVLLSTLRADLVPFGGARLGRTADGRVCLGLTAPGRYLLGETDDFDYATAAGAEILVQPDFEIVFLAPAPRLEPELARFADRIGAGVGALFRITRASVMRAAEQGTSADEVVGMLEGVSRTPVPANVARQIRDWIGGTRRVDFRAVLLIECPDEETAARVLALTAGHGQQITPTVIRLPPHALERKAFLKKLRDRGIFVSA